MATDGVHLGREKEDKDSLVRCVSKGGGATTGKTGATDEGRDVEPHNVLSFSVYLEESMW